MISAHLKKSTVIYTSKSRSAPHLMVTTGLLIPFPFQVSKGIFGFASEVYSSLFHDCIFVSSEVVSLDTVDHTNN